MKTTRAARKQVASNLGRAVAVARAARGWTQLELGKRSDLTSGFMSLFERGLRAASVDTVERIARALDVDMTTLVALGRRDDAVMDETIGAWVRQAVTS